MLIPMMDCGPIQQDRMLNVIRVHGSLLDWRKLMMEDAVIVKSLRTAVGKAPRGALKDTRPDDMAGAVIQRGYRNARHGLEPRWSKT